MSNRFGSPYVSGLSAIISCVLAIFLIMTSWQIYKPMYQVHQNPAYRFVTGGADIIDRFTSFLGLGKMDAGKWVRVMLGASASTLCMGALQAISSLSLLFGAAKQHRGLVMISSVISILGSLLCLGSWYAIQAYYPMFQDGWSGNTTEEIKNWQLTTLADGIFLFFSFCHSVGFARSKSKRNDNRANTV